VRRRRAVEIGTEFEKSISHDCAAACESGREKSKQTLCTLRNTRSKPENHDQCVYEGTSNVIFADDGAASFEIDVQCVYRNLSIIVSVVPQNIFIVYYILP